MAQKLSNQEKIQILLHYRDDFLRNAEYEERESENRMKFFLGLVTAVFAMFGALFETTFFEQHWFGLTLTSLIVLQLFGFLTFARIVTRTKRSDKLHEGFKLIDDSIISLDESFEKTVGTTLDKLNAKRGFLTDTLTGTLAQFMYLTHWLLAAVSTWIVLGECTSESCPRLVWSILLGVFVPLVMLICSHFVRKP